MAHPIMSFESSVGDTRQATAIARHWIDGRWQDSAENKDSIDPASGEVIGRYALAGEDEAREAVAAALGAFREMNWKHDRALRSRVLHEMAERFEAHAADLIQLMSSRVGEGACGVSLRWMPSSRTSTSYSNPYSNPASSHPGSLPPRRNPDETATTAG